MGFVWDTLSFLLSFLGSVGEKMIDKIERPVFDIYPYVDVRHWVPDLGVTSSPNPQYYGGTVSTDFIQKFDNKAPRYFAHVKIKNMTKYRGKNSTARQVFGKLTFYESDSDEVLLSNIYGRWAESIQPPMVLDVDALKYIDLLPDDEKTLDLCTRYYIHSDWYAVSTESYTADQFESSLNEIKAKVFLIKLELSGENIKEAYWFTVLNEGEGGIPRIIQVRTK